MIIVYNQIPNRRLPTEKFLVEESELNLVFVRLESYGSLEYKFYKKNGSAHYFSDLKTSTFTEKALSVIEEKL